MYVFNDRERADCPKRPYWGEVFLSCALLSQVRAAVDRNLI